jgi:catechol 2,3-dioxygenase-like lactoylglutathione lyase family enzyme
MMHTLPAAISRAKVSGPPQLKSFDHVSLPCRDLDEAIRFYRDVQGGEPKITEPALALFHVAGARVGVSEPGAHS